jgi:hypothetical protein
VDKNRSSGVIHGKLSHQFASMAPRRYGGMAELFRALIGDQGFEN